MTGQVIDRPELERFELPIGEDGLALALYRVEGDRIVLTHTEVPDRFAGQGVGSRLARGVLDSIRAAGRRAVPECPFMRAFVERHPEYSDMVDPRSGRGQGADR